MTVYMLPLTAQVTSGFGRLKLFHNILLSADNCEAASSQQDTRFHLMNRWKGFVQRLVADPVRNIHEDTYQQPLTTALGRGQCPTVL
jgi:hypothetical protein